MTVLVPLYEIQANKPSFITNPTHSDNQSSRLSPPVRRIRLHRGPAEALRKRLVGDADERLEGLCELAHVVHPRSPAVERGIGDGVHAAGTKIRPVLGEFCGEALALEDAMRRMTSASETGSSGFTTLQMTWKWLSITHQASRRTPENAAALRKSDTIWFFGVFSGTQTTFVVRKVSTESA